MNSLFRLPLPIAAATAEGDYVKSSIQSVLSGITGKPGDIFVLSMLALLLIFLLKKRYRGAAGCLVLVCGTVILRIIISILFGVQ